MKSAHWPQWAFIGTQVGDQVLHRGIVAAVADEFGDLIAGFERDHAVGRGRARSYDLFRGAG